MKTLTQKIIQYCIILTTLITLSMFMGILSINDNIEVSPIDLGGDSEVESTIIMPKSSASNDNTTVTNNNDGETHDKVLRGIESLNITFTDNSGNLNDPINFTVTVDTVMQWSEIVSKTGNYFTTEFTPSITNKTGLATLTLDHPTEGIIVTLDDNFTIENNFPKIGLLMDADEGLRGDTVELEIFPYDIEDAVGSLTWEVTLRNSTAEGGEIVETLVPKGDKIFNYSLEIPYDYKLDTMVINATIWDLNESKTVTKYYLPIVNNPSTQTLVEFEIDGDDVSNVADLYTIGVYRNDTILNVKLNCTDLDSDDDSLSLTRITAYDKLNNAEMDLDNETITDVSGPGYFEQDIYFPIELSLGLTNISLYITDIDGETTKLSYKILILNTKPEVHSFTVNGSKSSTFYQGNWIEFTFNVSDVDSEIAYCKVLFYYTTDGDNVHEFYYSVDYIDENTTLLIRASDFPSADYVAYLFVYDSDGGTYQSEPINFTISSEEERAWDTILLFIVGIVIGGLVGNTVAGFRVKKIEMQSELERSRSTDSPKDDKKTESDKRADKKSSEKEKKEKHDIQKSERKNDINRK